MNLPGDIKVVVERDIDFLELLGKLHVPRIANRGEIENKRFIV